MDLRFEELANHPSNDVFNIVFFPDRIYHAQYLNATRSPRYRYHVREVRGKADINVLKGEVILDSARLCNFLRVEYRASRLVEQARERQRLIQQGVIAWINLVPDNGPVASTQLRLEYCPWIDAFQAELWETLEPPRGSRHDYKVAAMMGKMGSITRVPAMSAALADLKALKKVELAFREDTVMWPSGYTIGNPNWDNFYQRSIQVPNTQIPSDDAQNTVKVQNYEVNFRRGFYIADASQIAPVLYRNGMMDKTHPEQNDDNVIQMRWLLQNELGSNLVFFHEVTIPPGKIEGTHQHIGSEELYYIFQGQGTAYLGEHDDPTLANFPLIDQPIYGLDVRKCREVPVKPGSVIFTKSGGIHGIRNTGTQPLKFVAFLYHSH